MDIKATHKKAVRICRKYPKNQIDSMTQDEYDFIGNYIQGCKSTHYLRCLLLVMPLGMMRYRLNQRIEFLDNEIRRK